MYEHAMCLHTSPYTHTHTHTHTALLTVEANGVLSREPVGEEVLLRDVRVAQREKIVKNRTHNQVPDAHFAFCVCRKGGNVYLYMWVREYVCMCDRESACLCACL